jgi:hypothetical protein
MVKMDANNSIPAVINIIKCVNRTLPIKNKTPHDIATMRAVDKLAMAIKPHISITGRNKRMVTFFKSSKSFAF